MSTGADNIDGNVHGSVGGSAPPPVAGQPVLDVFAVLAAMQQQLDDLRQIVQAQHRTLQVLLDDRPAPSVTAAGSSAVRGSR